MPKAKTTNDFMHTVPADIKTAVASSKKLITAWDSLTPLSRNEWVCWVTIVKKAETRKEHIVRMKAELLEGKRRPCCWPGCPHRRPDAAKWFSPKRTKK